MPTREPWEYEGVASQTTAELPCACGCHTSWAANPTQGGVTLADPALPSSDPQPAGDTRQGVANDSLAAVGEID